MRSITDQNGTKWTVSIHGSGCSVGVDEISEHISVMTLAFVSNTGETRYRSTGGSPRENALEAMSDNELLDLLNNGDEDL